VSIGSDSRKLVDNEASNFVLLAGETMLINGAETSRVEETMIHIGLALGASAVESFVIPTGIFVTLADCEGHTTTSMRRIRNRTINLDRIARVNELSRRLTDGRISKNRAVVQLQRIAKERTGFSLVPSMFASGIVGGSFAVLQNGTLFDVAGAFLAAFLVRYIAHLVSVLHGVQFTFEFWGAVAAAAIGHILAWLWPFLHSDIIIIGGIVPLVPGVAVTSAIRDVIAGDLLSGLSRSMEAALTSIAVAMGVVIVLALAAYRGVI
jgi:uncharacterized membrane protein YjjP (DUF1212 family)